MSQLFSPFKLNSPRGGLSLANRIVIAPMCQYASENGKANDWHLMHWGSLLNSGAGLFIIEATGVLPEGRITPNCLGLWDTETALALGDILPRAKKLAPYMPVGIQLAHAGRKSSSAIPWQGGALLAPESGGWQPTGPSPIPQLPNEKAPKELDSAEMNRIKEAFVQAAKYADEIGIELIEIHAAHGYLLHQFLSPLSNKREDAYGGSFTNRTRFPKEVFEAVRQIYSGVLGIRLSATDWADRGWTPDETADFAKTLKESGANFVHITSGGLSHQQQISAKPGFQLPFARLVKDKSGLPTIGVGLITEPAQAESAIQIGDADLVALARAFLYEPRWAWKAAAELGGEVTANPRYWRCPPAQASKIFGPNAKVGSR